MCIYKLNVKSMSMKKLTFLFLCLVLGIGLATAQTREITGSVVSAEDDQPVIGASVIVKGTTTGTVTDYDGKFSLSVPSAAKTLVISYIGMAAQEGHRFLDARRLGEKISVGNGTYKNFDVSKFVYPIPAKEVNAGFGVVQTTSWDANLPK